MSTLAEQAGSIAQKAVAFDHPFLPQAGKEVIRESAKLIAALAERVENLERRLAEHEQTAE